MILKFEQFINEEMDASKFKFPGNTQQAEKLLMGPQFIEYRKDYNYLTNGHYLDLQSLALSCVEFHKINNLKLTHQSFLDWSVDIYDQKIPTDDFAYIEKSAEYYMKNK